MIAYKNIPYYLAAAAIFILLKFIYTLDNNTSHDFLLTPTDGLVSLLTGSRSEYTSAGYYHSQLNILIDKSCSGLNFWMLCFTMLSFVFVNRVNNRSKKLFAIPLALCIAYLLTIVVNASRIYASVSLQGITSNVRNSVQLVIHEAIGIATSLTFLILIYCLAERIIKNQQENAKPA